MTRFRNPENRLEWKDNLCGEARYADDGLSGRQNRVEKFAAIVGAAGSRLAECLGPGSLGGPDGYGLQGLAVGRRAP